MTTRKRGRRAVLGTIAISAFGFLCCAAGSLLLSAGVLGAFGAFLAEPAVLAVAGLLAVIAIGLLVRRRIRRNAGSRCSPTDRTPR
jgi:cytochrome c biogenesis factor